MSLTPLRQDQATLKHVVDSRKSYPTRFGSFLTNGILYRRLQKDFREMAVNLFWAFSNSPYPPTLLNVVHTCIYIYIYYLFIYIYIYIFSIYIYIVYIYYLFIYLYIYIYIYLFIYIYIYMANSISSWDALCYIHSLSTCIQVQHN